MGVLILPSFFTYAETAKELQNKIDQKDSDIACGYQGRDVHLFGRTNRSCSDIVCYIWKLQYSVTNYKCLGIMERALDYGYKRGSRPCGFTFSFSGPYDFISDISAYELVCLCS